MIIDTHCHLNSHHFDNDRAAVFKRAAEAGVERFVTVATGPEEWRRCLDLAEGHPGVRVALGVHPHEADVFSEKAAQDLSFLARSDSRVVAIGETGLDFFRNLAPREKQYEAFRAQLRIAEELQKPFILHCRAAEAEMMEVLTEHRQKIGHSLCGVWHCFSSTAEYAARAAELGLYFGLGGSTTYPKSGELRKAVALMPPERILLETDCPYLPPQGFRGQRNEPAYLCKVVDTLVQVRTSTHDEVRRQTTENALRLFGTWNS